MNFYKFALAMAFLIVPAFACANPSPIPDIYCGATVSAIRSTTAVYLRSETVSVSIEKDEMAYVTADYALDNPSSSEVLQDVYLPFLERPTEASVTIDEKPAADAAWKRVTIHYYGNDYNRRQTLEASLDSLYCARKIPAGGTLRIRLDYRRDIIKGLNEPHPTIRTDFGKYGHRDWAENTYYNKCVYLSRTGASWPRPIESAAFYFKVHRSLLNAAKSFEDGSDHDSYAFYVNRSGFQKARKKFNDGHPVPYSKMLYLKKVSSMDRSYVYLENFEKDWVPEYDIGVCWIVTRAEAVGPVLLFIDEHPFLALLVFILVAPAVTYALATYFGARSVSGISSSKGIS